MENQLKYSSTIKSMAYLYLEIKKAAMLKIKGFKDFEIANKALQDNIFQVNTESRKREIASTVLKRLKVLDDYLLEKLANGSLETSKQIALYSIMKTDRLFFEFMTEVYREKYLLKDFIIMDKDFNIFFQRKMEQSVTVASWKEYTFYKLKQVYKRILSEAGFVKRQKKNIEIVPPIMAKDLIEHLKEIGDQPYLEAMLGVG
jgi:acetone carboxylase gamma subunit